jgi:integrase
MATPAPIRQQQADHPKEPGGGSVPGLLIAAQSPIVSLSGDDMARRRLQKNGDLYQQGGWWKLRWKEDQIDSRGNLKRGWSRPVWIGPALGPQRLTEKQAQRIAWDNFLSRIDQNTRVPQSIITVAEFVEAKFLPEHVTMKKKAGKIHYRAMLKHVIAPERVEAMFQIDAARAEKTMKSVPRWPYLGDLRLRDVKQEDVQRLVSAILARPRGNSVQTAGHVRSVVSAIFEHAKEKDWYAGDNPAARVNLPEMVRREAYALTLKQVQMFLSQAGYPEREMALIAILTSMNVAEICGLQWKRVNLANEWTSCDGDALPPMTIAVRKQWYRAELGSVKKKSRVRDVPIPEDLLPILLSLQQRGHHTGPDDFVLVSRAGTPIDEHNVAARHLKAIGKRIGMPWLSWHVFRRTHTTLAKELGMEFSDRMAMMGHSEARMTILYTKDSIERRRKVVDLMASKILMKMEAGPIQ